MAELEALWPLKRFPVLVDEGRTVIEATIIIEHLDLHHPGPVRLIPEDPEGGARGPHDGPLLRQLCLDAAAEARLRPHPAGADRDPYGVAEARAMLDTAYRWLDRDDGGANGPRASFQPRRLRRCAVPFYADWTHPIGGSIRTSRLPRTLLARPSFARAVDEARPYRRYFPLGAPDRD